VTEGINPVLVKKEQQMGGLAIVASPSLQSYTETENSIPGGMPESVRAQLERILSSSTFIRSRRLGRFLRFTVEQALAGRQSALKEYLVGVEVFNKTESFDPRIDSIVRVEARRLRSKLEQYYQTEGNADQIIVHLPKGSYVPLILDRSQMPQIQQSKLANSARNSISVLPFTDLDSDSADHAFCSGLTEDLISALTKIDNFRVVARHNGGTTSSEPKSSLVLEGSVRRHGSRLRITAQLVDVERDEYVWCETYERDTTDVFAVQEELSRAIVTALASRN